MYYINLDTKLNFLHTKIPKHQNLTPSHPPKNDTNRNARSISTVERLAFS